MFGIFSKKKRAADAHHITALHVLYDLLKKCGITPHETDSLPGVLETYESEKNEAITEIITVLRNSRSIAFTPEEGFSAGRRVASDYVQKHWHTITDERFRQLLNDSIYEYNKTIVLRDAGIIEAEFSNALLAGAMEGMGYAMLFDVAKKIDKAHSEPSTKNAPTQHEDNPTTNPHQQTKNLKLLLNAEKNRIPEMSDTELLHESAISLAWVIALGENTDTDQVLANDEKITKAKNLISSKRISSLSEQDFNEFWRERNNLHKHEITLRKMNGHYSEIRDLPKRIDDMALMVTEDLFG